MKLFNNPNSALFKQLSSRPALDASSLKNTVQQIFREVVENGDQALLDLTEKFDKTKLDKVAIDLEIANSAWKNLDRKLQKSIQNAAKNIRSFHQAQVQNPIDLDIDEGISLGQKSVPIKRIGIYIPAGTAPLISTTMMLAIPAVVAGCQEIVLCSPPTSDGMIHPAILATAAFCGVTEIYAIGGAQAIAGLTIGTESIRSVQKIFGPGNQYVTAAKALAQSYGVAMDLPAGPSELLVYADETSIPEFVAADLLSQAEHGVDSQVVLVSPQLETIKAVEATLYKQLQTLPRKETAQKAIENSFSVVLDDLDSIIQFINIYGPEHLILSGTKYQNIFDKIESAGSIFLGNYCPESAGDYASGTNHTLPTNGWAHSYSGVNIDAFTKKITYQSISESGLTKLAETITTLARAEQLEAHARAIDIRFQTPNVKHL